MEIYMRKEEAENLKELYDSIKDDPESQLSRQQNTYNILHSMSINVGDTEMTPFFYFIELKMNGELQELVWP